eukprot:scaffold17661_cov48-Attheya_sp.AAC.1
MHEGEGRNCNLEPTKDGPSSRLSRFILPNSNEIDVSTEKVILETGPSGRMHNGGAMAFGNDGYIYIATGDTGYNRSKNPAPKLNNLFGKILRITDDGAIPKDNPYYNTDNKKKCNDKNTNTPANGGDKECPEIFSVGFRNPFNLDMDPRKDKVRFLVGDVGRGTWEEISEGGHGFEKANYGWRGREGPCEQGEIASNKCGLVNKKRLTDPIHWYRNTDDDGGAITGGAFVPPGIWPDKWDGEFLYSDLRAGNLYHMKYTPSNFCRGTKCSDQTSAYTAVPLVENFPGTLLRLKFGPHRDTQALYLIEYNRGKIYRLSYTGNMNRRPKPVIQTFLSSNGNGLTVDFDGSESSDPDGDEVSFEWNFGEDESVSSRDKKASYTYSSKGQFIATLTVTDGKGSNAATSVEINVEENPKPLAVFPWSSGEACKDDDQSYDYCGSLEFCTNGDIHGYRLPGEEECTPRLSPVIRVTPGKMYKFTLRNTSPEGNPTNIHTHGLHISGSGDADDVTRIVHGGNRLDYMTGGAVGLLIVDDKVEDALPKWTSNELLLQILRVHGNVFGNGKHYEVFNVEAKKWYRLRMSTVDPLAVPLELRFTPGCKMHKVASDGIWHSRIPGDEGLSFEMTGASRGDFAIRCESPNSFVNILYGGEVAAILSIGIDALIPDNADLESWSPVRPPSLQDSSLSGGVRSMVVVTSENQFKVNVQRDSINDKKWDVDTPLTTIGFNEAHEWSISDTREHPFHMHLYHMQIVTSGGCGSHKEGEFYDTISGPPCTIRFKTADFGERMVMHCHVMMHSDVGSMAWVDVQPRREGQTMPINNVTSLEYVWKKDDVDDSDLTSSPVSTPLPSQIATASPSKLALLSPSQIPTSPPSKLRRPTLPQVENRAYVLLDEDDLISTDETVSSRPEGYYLYLNNTGQLELHQGSPGRSEAKLWTSPNPGAEGDYFAKIRSDGHFQIREGTVANKGDFVWKSLAKGPSDVAYFLEYDPVEQMLAVRQGLPEDRESSLILWYVALVEIT